MEEEQVDGEEEEDEEEDEGEEEEIESVARLEHLPPFTERWALEALTSHVLSQVILGGRGVARCALSNERACVCGWLKRRRRFGVLGSRGGTIFALWVS